MMVMSQEGQELSKVPQKHRMLSEQAFAILSSYIVSNKGYHFQNRCARCESRLGD